MVMSPLHRGGPCCLVQLQVIDCWACHCQYENIPAHLISACLIYRYSQTYIPWICDLENAVVRNCRTPYPAVHAVVLLPAL